MSDTCPLGPVDVAQVPGAGAFCDGLNKKIRPLVLPRLMSLMGCSRLSICAPLLPFPLNRTSKCMPGVTEKLPGQITPMFCGVVPSMVSSTIFHWLMSTVVLPALKISM